MTNRPPRAEVEGYLRKILESKVFVSAEEQGRLLSAIVLGTLDGDDTSNKALARKPGKSQTNVRASRVQAIQKLKRYYREIGNDDNWTFDIQTRGNKARILPSVAPPSNSSAVALSDGVWSVFDRASPAMRAFFSITEKKGLRCIVTGRADADWFYLDGDRERAILGNIIPLSGDLRSHIDRAAKVQDTTGLPELEPNALMRLAAKHFNEWKMAEAYGCAHLASYVGSLSCYHDKEAVRLHCMFCA